jgi:hypothetical protein
MRNLILSLVLLPGLMDLEMRAQEITAEIVVETGSPARRNFEELERRLPEAKPETFRLSEVLIVGEAPPTVAETVLVYRCTGWTPLQQGVGAVKACGWVE